MPELGGETIVVTGASRGLGESMTRRFSAEGANVVLVARSTDRIEAIADDVPGPALAAPADVTDDEQVTGMVEAAITEFGRVDTLVNNAGIGLLSLVDQAKPLVEVTREEWERILAVNLTGVFVCTKAVLPGMIEHERGNIINISSGVGRRVKLIEGSAWGPYTVSKFGLEALTTVTALEYEDDGINANSLDPGGRVLTRFWDHLPENEHDRLLRSDVMDDAAVLLAAQESFGITGESMNAQDWEARFEHADSV